MTARRRTDRGAAATELAILVPVLVLLLSVVVGGGRVWTARSSVQQAAGAAARAASLERTPAAAQAVARQAFTRNLAQQGLTCASAALDVDARGLAKPPGTSATVSVRARCRVELRDVLVPGMPGAVDAEATGVAVVDTYRGR